MECVGTSSEPTASVTVDARNDFVDKEEEWNAESGGEMEDELKATPGQSAEDAMSESGSESSTEVDSEFDEEEEEEEEEEVQPLETGQRWSVSLSLSSLSLFFKVKHHSFCYQLKRLTFVFQLLVICLGTVFFQLQPQQR